jgi:hypothetical protein
MLRTGWAIHVRRRAGDVVKRREVECRDSRMVSAGAWQQLMQCKLILSATGAGLCPIGRDWTCPEWYRGVTWFPSSEPTVPVLHLEVTLELIVAARNMIIITDTEHTTLSLFFFFLL